MKSKAVRSAWTLVASALLVSWLAVTFSGCATGNHHSQQVGQLHELHVVPLINREVAALTADDVVRIMTRAGFHDAEILELGPDLRNALATEGSAEIRVRERTVAIFSIEERYVYGTSIRGGNLIYPLESGWSTSKQGS